MTVENPSEWKVGLLAPFRISAQMHGRVLFEDLMAEVTIDRDFYVCLTERDLLLYEFSSHSYFPSVPFLPVPDVVKLIHISNVSSVGDRVYFTVRNVGFVFACNQAQAFEEKVKSLSNRPS